MNILVISLFKPSYCGFLDYSLVELCEYYHKLVTRHGVLLCNWITYFVDTPCISLYCGTLKAFCLHLSLLACN